MRRLILAAAAILAAGGGAQAQSNREPIRYWFEWPNGDYWSRVEHWVPQQSEAVRCVLQEQRSGLTWDGMIYLPGTAPPPRVDTVRLVRVDTVWRTDTLFLPPDTVGSDTVPTEPEPPAMPVRLDTVVVVEGSGIEVTVTARDSAGTVAGLPLAFTISGGSFANGTCCVILRTTQASGVTGVAWVGYSATDSLTVTATGAATVVVRRDPPAQPTPVPVPLPPPGPVDSTVVTPAGLEPIVGRLVPRSATAGPVAVLDNRFAANEAAAYQNSISLLDQNAANIANHYDALIGRFAREVRDGTYPGTYYAHGREVVIRYLAWSKANAYAIPPHNNTGLAGIELLAVLEGNADARMHIWCRAGFDSGTDAFGYLQGTNRGSDPRQVAVALQAQMAAIRLGVDYRACPPNGNTAPQASLGSWIAAGQRLIGWLEQNWVDADGTVISNAHHDQCGRPECEAYFMSAMLATELLRWVRDVSADPVALELAGRIVGHLADEWQRVGGPLGYLTNRAPGSANDLAAFYVWPALVLWQESGETRLRDFALAHMQAAASAPNQAQAKQWQQVHSTHAHEAEALLGGVRWR